MKKNALFIPGINRKMKKLLLTMRLGIYILLITTLSTFADGFSQNVTINLSMKNATLKEMINEVRNEYGLNFLFQVEELEKYDRKDVALKGASLEETMNDILNGTNLSYEINRDVIVILPITPNNKTLQKGSSEEFRQSIEITGTVTGAEDGLSIPGASVVVKNNPTIGTTTDLNGKYSLTIPSSAESLLFSFIGMKTQEVSINGRSVIDIQLESELLEMDEVIVVAYGTIKKASFTGSASVVGEKELRKITTPSINKALLGASPGLRISSSSGQPGAQSSIRIRGTGSLSASSRPLYVIDGIPILSGTYSMSGDEPTDLVKDNGSGDILSTLNIADIESITVLKDAAAASMYGSAAANGVILITTKKGKAGESKISFSAKYGVQTLQKSRYDLMNSEQIYKIYYDAYYVEALQTAQDFPVTYANSETATALSYNPYNVANPLDANGNLVSGARLVVDNNWRDVVFRTATTRDYNLQAKGGTEKTSYFASAGYGFHEGTSIASNFEKFTGKLNVSSKMNDFIKIGMENTLGHTIQNSAPGGTSGASIFQKALLLSNAIPNYIIDNEGNPILNANGNVQHNYNNPVAQEYNPEGLSNLNIYKVKTYRAISSIWAEVNFLKDFKFKTTANADYVSVRDDQYWNPFYGDGNSHEGWGGRWAQTDLSWTLSNILSYAKSFNDHSLTALAGYEATENNYDYVSTFAKNYVILGDVLVPELDNAATPTSASSYKISSSKVSVFGRINYDYNSKYYLQAGIRNDGSSKFGPDKRYGTFYSVSVSWRISEEAFMNSISWLSDMKLRASYGTSGNDAIADFKFMALYEPYKYNDQSGYKHDQLPNSELHWEANVNSNIALDVTLFNKVSLTYEYYDRKSTDLLYEKPLPLSTGFEDIETNFASLKNFGHEVEIQANLIATSELRFDVGLNLALNKEEIIKLASEQTQGSKIWREGGTRYEFYLKEWAGIDKATGEPLWYMDDADGNRVVTTSWDNADKYEQGKSSPDAFGSFTSDLYYKGFDFSLMIYYSIGGKIYDYTENDLFYTGGGNKGHNLTTAIEDYWTPENPDAKYPRFVIDENLKSYERSTLFLHDATFAQLKSITLGYTIPQNVLNKIFLTDARIYISAENIFSWYKDKDLKVFDPDVGVMGTNYYRTPAPKTISFGINIGL